MAIQRESYVERELVEMVNVLDELNRVRDSHGHVADRLQGLRGSKYLSWLMPLILRIHSVAPLSTHVCSRYPLGRDAGPHAPQYWHILRLERTKHLLEGSSLMVSKVRTYASST